jgi:hypothetical protein
MKKHLILMLFSLLFFSSSSFAGSSGGEGGGGGGGHGGGGGGASLAYFGTSTEVFDFSNTSVEKVRTVRYAQPRRCRKGQRRNSSGICYVPTKSHACGHVRKKKKKKYKKQCKWVRVK